MESSIVRDGSSGRRAYGRPTVRRIELLAEEVLGVGCKKDTESAMISGGTCKSASCNIANGLAS